MHPGSGEAAATAPLREWADRIAARRRSRIARKLAGILFAIWRDGTAYDVSKLGSGGTKKAGEHGFLSAGFAMVTGAVSAGPSFALVERRAPDCATDLSYPTTTETINDQTRSLCAGEPRNAMKSAKKCVRDVADEKPAEERKPVTDANEVPLGTAGGCRGQKEGSRAGIPRPSIPLTRRSTSRSSHRS